MVAAVFGCTHPGCNSAERGKRIRRGLCDKHYQAARLSGTLPALVAKATGFACVSCSQHTTKVMDSRPTAEGYTRRRHACQACNHRFTTIEVPLELWKNTDLREEATSAREALAVLVEKFNSLNRVVKATAKYRVATDA